MPIPKKGESEKDFVDRCMAYPDLQDREPDQRAAICHSLWRDHQHPSSAARGEPLMVERATVDEILTVTDAGEISGYACTWAFDGDGIRFEPGSFKKTITERAGKIPLTVKHTKGGSSVMETVGWVMSGEEDAKGLRIVGKFLDTEFARAVRAQAKAGGVKAFSIMAKPITYVRDAATNIIKATEAFLQDVTLTNIPLDENAQVLAVRTEDIATATVATPPVVVPSTPTAVAASTPAVEPPAPTPKIVDTRDAAIMRQVTLDLLSMVGKDNAARRTLRQAPNDQ